MSVEYSLKEIQEKIKQLEKGLEDEKKKFALLLREQKSMKKFEPVNNNIINSDGDIQIDGLDDNNTLRFITFNTEGVNNFDGINELYDSLKIPDFIAFEDCEGIDIDTFCLHARQWILKAEEIFKLKNTPEMDKSRLAAISLKGLAFSWYTQELKTSKQNGMSWEEFKIFFKKYAIPGLENSQLYYDMEMLNIKMDKNMNVREYTAKFWKIKHRSTVDEESEMYIYLNGLPIDMRDAILKQSPNDLVSSIKMAYAVEIESKLMHDITPSVLNVRRKKHRGEQNTFKNNSTAFNCRGQYRFNNNRGYSNNNCNRKRPINKFNSFKKNRGNNLHFYRS